MTGGYWKRLSGFRARSQNVIKMPENPVSIFSASTPQHRIVLLGRTSRTVSTSHIPTIRGRLRAASGPRQGAKNIGRSSETASPPKIFDFQDFWIMQFLRSRTRPWCTQIVFHEFFCGTRAEPYQSVHNKEGSDGRISKTIVKILSRTKTHQNARKSC